MDRLTVRRSEGRFAIANKDGATPTEQVLKIPMVINRLAAYEDTGLEPEEITALIGNDHVKYHLLYEYQQLGTIDYLRELAQADREGRCVVLPDAKYTDTGGETALRRAMYICGVQNNPVTRYTADAIAEKLTREEAEAALKGGTHETNPV